MSDQQLQELRELGAMLPGEVGEKVLIEVSNWVNQISEGLEGALRGDIDTITVIRNFVYNTPENLKLLATVALKSIVLELTFTYPYTAFAAQIGREFYREVSDQFHSSRESLRVGNLVVMVISHLFPDLLSIKREAQKGSRRGKARGATLYTISAKADLSKYRNALETNPKYNHLPMICLPKDWVSTFEGGYITNGEAFQLPFIRSKGGTVQESYSYEDIPLYYDAVNYLQETPWIIDSDQLALVKKAMHEQWEVRKFPFSEVIPELLRYPLGDDKRKYKELSELEQNLVKEWITVNSSLEKKRKSIPSRVKAITSAVNIAESLKQYPNIYFPHSPDYRGRGYPLPVILHPQGSDCIKSLLANGVPEPLKDERAVRWAKLSIANFQGQSGSYTSRLKWFEDNEQDILAFGRHPEKYTKWFQFDKPWQFIQAAKEWVKYTEDPSTPLRLFIYFDGSCNGIQHFSAMRRDIVGGTSTNLFPSEDPNDLYNDIIEAVQKDIEPINTPFAQYWKQVGTSRNTVKRSVMCLPYGLTLYSCGEYVEEWLVESDADTQQWTHRELSEWFNRYLWKNMRKHLKGACEVMDYLHLCVQIACKEGIAIEWPTPWGLIVDKVHYAKEKIPCSVNLSACGLGKRVELVLRVPKNEISLNKTKLSISPNFTHSHDAVHFCDTALRMKKGGVPAICGIHDSIGVHPNYGDLLEKEVRVSFVELYKDRDVLQDLRDHMMKTHGLELPPVPPFSSPSFDFDQILASPYFFS